MNPSLLVFYGLGTIHTLRNQDFGYFAPHPPPCNQALDEMTEKMTYPKQK